MRKIYLLGLMGAFTFANAQAPKISASSLTTQPKHVILQDYIPATSVVVNDNKPASTVHRNYFGKTTAPLPVKVGSTYFSIQTNSSVYRRINTYPGNKVAVIWTTAGQEVTPGTPLSRGTGYNFYNGSAWGAISTTRIEPFRTGYPNFDFNPTLNKEVVMSHRVDTNGKSQGLVFNLSSSLGSGIWSSTIVLDTPSITTHPSVLWSRTAISGNYMHVIANYSSPSSSNTTQTDTVKIKGVKSPTVYSRYNFTSNLWEVKNITLPGYDSTRWFAGSSDNYSMDASGSNVAVLIGGLDNDITLWKSADNGLTWTNRIIDSFPFPAYDNKTPFPGTHLNDTIRVCDNSLNVKLDNTGKAHCFWGRMTISWNQTSAALGLFLGTNNSIDYWYEGRPNAIMGQIGYSPDQNNDSIFNPGTINSRNRYGDAGCATGPYATIDALGKIYLLYSGITEANDDGQGGNFRDIYCVFSTDNGSTWSTPRNLTKTSASEEMFASAPASIDNNLQLTFMQSSAAGNYDATSNASKTGPFDIMYLSIPTADIPTLGVDALQNDLFTLDQNYPNPFNGTTIVPVTLKKTTDVKINVINIVGQTVYSQNFDKAQVGINKFSLDLTHLNGGVYFYTVEAEGYKVTKRMIVE